MLSDILLVFDKTKARYSQKLVKKTRMRKGEKNGCDKRFVEGVKIFYLQKKSAVKRDEFELDSNREKLQSTQNANYGTFEKRVGIDRKLMQSY